ncbi:MAG: Nif3-like dinuclear metal center hexameric protein [Bacteroidetes bacterium]|nr:Nif3-like dinuclear metal center hexameric protein [Bacteroidota bacterium]MBT5528160.1 Nif3-like dinuclear metal center hexameric protein [Cytophagia bacterium]MBT3424725.1 Nif3-like dinuclear metal center hexameric protein [Bacteroidota bacterium]MBT3935524.1 Nif3-like dinuclear metal center hexameric protein [Bacteroidota bacterium]MBT4339698.1 Nif3-like dinuclear metal center hexameric protein [Bacteroidota bacterium]
MMILKEIIAKIEEQFPSVYQEDYDNSGLICGSDDLEINGINICVDVTEDVLNEAIKNGQNLIVSHHPILFKGIKKLKGSNYVERILIQAIKNDIAIYAVHTNMDNMWFGINTYLANLFGLKNIQVLKPLEKALYKITVFCPDMKLSDGQYVPGKVRNAMFGAGAGKIGDYDSCSFNYDGYGTYRGLEGTDPFIGSKGKTNVQKEVKIETVVPVHLKSKVINAMLEAHPYEEVAYDVFSLDNAYSKAGAGVIGDLPLEMKETDFLKLIKEKLGSQLIRHSQLLKQKVSKVAICGGSGSFLLKDALMQKAQAFISADFKYHEFFDADHKILISDVGHFESEQFTIDILHDLLIKNFTTFAISKTKVNTNPINYF